MAPKRHNSQNDPTDSLRLIYWIGICLLIPIAFLIWSEKQKRTYCILILALAISLIITVRILVYSLTLGVDNKAGRGDKGKLKNKKKK